jgi:2-dehydropantoate 2-reductase
MTIAIIGAGAIGSVVAAYLHKAGINIVLVGTPEQVEAVSQTGLHAKGVRGEETLKIKILPKLDQHYDWVIFTTKTQDLEGAYQHNSQYLEECVVLTTQNGIQADNILSSHFDRNKMYSSIVMFGATYTTPGEVVLNFEGDWIIGKPFGPVDQQAHQLAEMLNKAFPTVVAPNISGMKWLKLFVNFNNCIPALIGKSMQETFADMDFCKLSVLLLKEGVDIVTRARVELVSLPKFPRERIYGLASMPLEQAAGIMNKTLTSLSKEPLYGSILQSIMRQRPSEIDFINGEVVHLAAQMRQEAPLNRRVIDLVHQVERNGTYLNPQDVKKEFDLN